MEWTCVEDDEERELTTMCESAEDAVVGGGLENPRRGNAGMDGVTEDIEIGRGRLWVAMAVIIFLASSRAVCQTIRPMLSTMTLLRKA